MASYLLQKRKEEKAKKKAKKAKTKARREDETPEERRARKERKRARKELKALKKSLESKIPKERDRNPRRERDSSRGRPPLSATEDRHGDYDRYSRDNRSQSPRRRRY